MADIAFISDFLTRVEGKRQTLGYIPCYLRDGSGKTANYRGGPNPERYKAMGVSGVTIATGCDLGQTDYPTLLAYGLDPAIAVLFRFYFGKKKDVAINALYEMPLSISAEQALAVDHAVHGGYLDKQVRPAWEKASPVKFDDLPREAQAVVMSVCFHKGCGGVRRDCPKLWKYLIQCDWASAAWELQNGFKQYASRRAIEGRFLALLGGTA